MKYSYVIPCYNSALTIESVVDQINLKMKEMSETSYEIILVNDYSKDNTKEVIFNLANKHKNVIAITMSKNFGQHAALLAGYNNVSGEYVISLDDDGQTPPSEVDKLINKLQEGHDVVFANYKVKHHSTFRNIGSKLNDYMATKLIQKPKGLYLSSFHIARRYVIDEVIKYKGPFPYISGLILRVTVSTVNVDVEHKDRDTGNSGYNIYSLFKLWLNGFTAFSIKPLRVSMYIGGMVAVFGFLAAFYSVVNKLLNTDTPVGWSSLIAITAIVGGTILVMLGVIGEYIGRIYLSLNHDPQYIIKEIKGKNNE